MVCLHYPGMRNIIAMRSLSTVEEVTQMAFICTFTRGLCRPSLNTEPSIATENGCKPMNGEARET